MSDDEKTEKGAWKEFADDSSFHGIAYVAMREMSLVRR